MKHILPFIALGMTAMAMQSCEDSVSQAGSSLVEDEVEIIEDSSFAVKGVSDPNNAVRSRTVLQLLGRLSAEGYGDFSSDIVHAGGKHRHHQYKGILCRLGKTPAHYV